MVINITPEGVVESTLMYGIVHAIWLGLRWLGKRLMNETRKERNRLIHQHVKNGHEGRFHGCQQGECSPM